MTDVEQQLVMDFVSKRISESALLARFPVDLKTDRRYVLRVLEETLNTKRKDDVECAMILGFHFGFPADSGPVLCKLILEDWHTQHENLAAVMQKLKDPQTVDCLYQTALARFPYLEFDEAHALAVKCLWALSDINTDKAREKLKLLIESENKIIRENAERLLNRSFRLNPGT